MSGVTRSPDRKLELPYLDMANSSKMAHYNSCIASFLNDSSLNDANWHHFIEMIPNGIIYFSDLYLVFLTNLKVWKGHKHDGPTFFFGQNVLL